MKMPYHVITSVGLAVLIGLWFKSLSSAFVCFFSGVFIDLDHLVEFYINKRRWTFSYKELMDFCGNESHGRLVLFAHTYEGLLLFWFLIDFFHLGPWWVAIAMGLTVHVLCDQFTNPLRPLSYFFFYRLKQDFQREKLHTPEFLQSKRG